jgi:hypothetical protein
VSVAVQGYACHQCGLWNELPPESLKEWNKSIRQPCKHGCGAVAEIKRGQAKAVRP